MSIGKLINKSIVFQGKGKVEIVLNPINLNEIEDNNFLVIELIYSWVSSGTELSVLNGYHPGFKSKIVGYPYRPGYSSVGKVVFIKGTFENIKIEDTIFFRGPHQKFSIIQRDDFFIKINTYLNLKDVVFLSALRISLFPIFASNFRFGQKVLILGLGVIGLLAGKFFDLAGAYSITGLDRNEMRIRKSRDFGFTDSIKPEDLKGIVSSKVGGRKYDLIVDASGSQELLSVAFDLVKTKGEVILLSVPDNLADVNLYEKIMRPSIKVIGAHDFHFKLDSHLLISDPYTMIIQLIKRSKLDLGNLITDIVKLEEMPNFYSTISSKNNLGILIQNV